MAKRITGLAYFLSIFQLNDRNAGMRVCHAFFYLLISSLTASATEGPQAGSGAQCVVDAVANPYNTQLRVISRSRDVTTDANAVVENQFVINRALTAEEETAIRTARKQVTRLRPSNNLPLKTLLNALLMPLILRFSS